MRGAGGEEDGGEAADFSQGGFPPVVRCPPPLSGHTGSTCLWGDSPVLERRWAAHFRAWGGVVTGPSHRSQTPQEETTLEDAVWSSLEPLFGT